jgi:hypothetical protein
MKSFLRGKSVTLENLMIAFQKCLVEDNVIFKQVIDRICVKEIIDNPQKKKSETIIKLKDDQTIPVKKILPKYLKDLIIIL